MSKRGLEEVIQRVSSDAYRGRNEGAARRIIECSLSQHRYLEAFLSEGRGVLDTISGGVQEVRTISLTSRYLAQHLETEAARLAEGGESFKTLALSVHNTVDQIESTVHFLQQSIRKGAMLMQKLANEVKSR